MVSSRNVLHNHPDNTGRNCSPGSSGKDQDVAEGLMRIRGPRRVLFLTTGFNIGGAETFLANLLNNIDRDRIQPIVVSLSESRDLKPKLDTSISYQEITRRWRYDLKPAREIALLVKKEKIESIFSIGPYPFFYARLALAMLREQPRVFLSLHSTKRRSTYEHFQWVFYLRLLRRTDVLLGVCHNQAKYLSDKYHIPLNRFVVIYNGVDLDRWTLPPGEFDRTQARAGLGITEAAKVIVQVAEFRMQKRHEDSLRALAIMHHDSHFKPYLLLVGAGEAETENRFRQLSCEYGISSHVKFCGQQTDVRPFYWISNLFTLSSVSETFSIAALEAMATGLPCVLTDVGGAREMIDDGINGYVVPPENPQVLAGAWERILEKEHDFSPNAIRETVSSRFSLKVCIQSYEQLLSIP